MTREQESTPDAETRLFSKLALLQHDKEKVRQKGIDFDTTEDCTDERKDKYWRKFWVYLRSEGGGGGGNKAGYTAQLSRAVGEEQ